MILPIFLVLALAGGPVSEAEVLRLALPGLPRTLGADSLRWSLASPWGSLQVPAGATGLRLVRPPGTVRPGLVPCSVQVLRGAEVLRSAQVALRADRVGASVRLVHAGRSGQYLAADDLDLAWGVLPLGERPLADPAHAVGMRLMRSLPEGSWLPGSYLQPRPVVLKGQSLLVEAGGPGMILRFTSVAQQDGGPGQVISARGPRAGSLLKVKIVSAGMAELVP